MLLEISRTIEFFPLARPRESPASPAGVFFSQSGALSPAGSPVEQRPIPGALVGDREARADGQGRQLIDGVAAGAPVRQLLLVEPLGHARVPFAGVRPDHSTSTV